MEMPVDFQHQAMGYDRTATMFSPEGKLLQVEYAEKTVRLGNLSVGMRCADGVFIIAVKRIRDILIAPESLNEIYEIDSHIISSIAGIVSDARVLVERAQIFAQKHRVTYDSPITPELIIKDIANTKQQFTQYGGARPFGLSLMIAGINDTEPVLYSSDVTGNYYSYYTNAVGQFDEKIKDTLRERYKKTLTIKQGVKIVLDSLKEILSKDFDINNLELAYINTKEKNIKRVLGEKIKEL